MQSEQGALPLLRDVPCQRKVYFDHKHSPLFMSSRSIPVVHDQQIRHMDNGIIPYIPASDEGYQSSARNDIMHVCCLVQVPYYIVYCVYLEMRLPRM